MAHTYVADAIVPLELTLRTSPIVTLYQPGFHAEPGGSAFPGGAGKVLAFDSLADLSSYVESDAIGPYTNAEYLNAIRQWTIEEYTTRLCPYHLAEPPELADRTLSEHEQLSLGSMLAVGLDLLDQLRIDDAHAQAMRDDPDIGRLASGAMLGGVFGGGRRRQHVVDLLSEHWAACVEQITQRVVVPDPGELTALIEAGPPATPVDTDADAGAGRGVPAARATAGGASAGGPDAEDGDPDDDSPAGEAGPVPLEVVTDLVTLWFGLTDRGVYTIRTCDLTDGTPTYPVPDGATERRLSVWPELEGMQRDLTEGRLGLEDPTLIAVEEVEVDLTPSDDMIFDLVEIGETIDPRLSVEHADRLVTAWTELVRLAEWGRWSDTLRLVGPGSEIGQYIVSVAVDRAQDRTGVQNAMSTADIASVHTGWTRLIQTLEKHLIDR